MARIPCLFQLRLEIKHVTVAVTESGRFAEPDAINHTGMIQLVRDDSVFRLQQSLKQSAVGIETGTIEDSVVSP